MKSFRKTFNLSLDIKTKEKLFCNKFFKISFLKSAIDDTEITHQGCKPTNECDFETDWCDFKNSTLNGYFSWTRGTNFTATPGTGPTSDHVDIF